ncbi:hypothetical protein FACS189431_8740 [Alphaproteobacteria bacterium]|nr:hypothetical protein FACS189431_8740 [Alphaproteobacteria bacterium]
MTGIIIPCKHMYVQIAVLAAIQEDYGKLVEQFTFKFCKGSMSIRCPEQFSAPVKALALKVAASDDETVFNYIDKAVDSAAWRAAHKEKIAELRILGNIPPSVPDYKVPSMLNGGFLSPRSCPDMGDGASSEI